MAFGAVALVHPGLSASMRHRSRCMSRSRPSQRCGTSRYFLTKRY